MTDPSGYPGPPRWLKMSGIAVATLAVLVVVLAIFGGGRHGPGRHFPSMNMGDDLPASASTE